MKNENSTTTCAPDYESMYEELQKKFDRLKAQNKEFDEKIIMQLGLIDYQKEEIERYLHSIKLLENDVKTAKEEAVKEFGHFLIDEAEGGKIHTIDIPDYVQEFTEVRE